MNQSNGFLSFFFFQSSFSSTIKLSGKYRDFPFTYPLLTHIHSLPQSTSVQFSLSVMSYSLRPHGLQHTRPPCPSPTPRKLMSIESVMPSNHLILCHPLLLLPLNFPSIRVFSKQSALRIRWPKYWSFSISPSSEYSGLIFFKMDWLDLLAVQGTLKSLLQHHSSKASVLLHSAFLIVQLSHPYMTYQKNHSFDQMDLCWQSNVSAF